MRVLGAVMVGTGTREFFAPVSVVAILAHALGVEWPVDVGALGDLSARATLLRLLWLLGLLRLARLSH